jgi:hypothetical protein
MSFIQKKLDRSVNQSRGIFDKYIYRTDDTLVDVSQEGYFLESRFTEDWAGGVIECICSDGFGMASILNNGSIKFFSSPITGWASYVDTQYTTVGTAFTVPANTDTIYPNNSGFIIDNQKPVDVDTFYDGSVIPGRNGDSLDLMMYCLAIPTANSQWAEVWLDIGGAVGDLYRQTFAFPKGAGVVRGLMYSLASGYTLDTWEANGATAYIRSSHDLDIYQINFNFDRSHKAR